MIYNVVISITCGSREEYDTWETKLDTAVVSHNMEWQTKDESNLTLVVKQEAEI